MKGLTPLTSLPLTFPDFEAAFVLVGNEVGLALQYGRHLLAHRVLVHLQHFHQTGAGVKVDEFEALFPAAEVVLKTGITRRGGQRQQLRLAALRRRFEANVVQSSRQCVVVSTGDERHCESGMVVMMVTQ